MSALVPLVRLTSPSVALVLILTTSWSSLPEQERIYIFTYLYLTFVSLVN